MTPPPPTCHLRRGRPAACGTLVRATDGATPSRLTSLTLLDDGERLRVSFECEAPEPWASHLERDAPLWEEEVVELFLAPGAAPPRVYYELELNPIGAVFDARVESPHGDRRGMRVDAGWDCAELEMRSTIDAAAGIWRAELALPWRVLADPGEKLWRLNAFRIDRPRGGEPEFSAWSPTFVHPADFHLAHRFGFVTRIE